MFKAIQSRVRKLYNKSITTKHSSFALTCLIQNHDCKRANDREIKKVSYTRALRWNHLFSGLPVEGPILRPRFTDSCPIKSHQSMKETPIPKGTGRSPAVLKTETLRCTKICGRVLKRFSTLRRSNYLLSYFDLRLSTLKGIGKHLGVYPLDWTP